MSDRTVKLIPLNRDFVPSRAAADRAKTFLEEQLQGVVDSVDVQFFNVLTYIDGYETTKLVCRQCKAITGWGPSAWWSALQEDLYKDNFDLGSYNIHMPCCGELVPVLSVDFAATAGFSRFVINANDSAPVEAETIEAMQSILGCQLQVIEAWMG